MLIEGGELAVKVSAVIPSTGKREMELVTIADHLGRFCDEIIIRIDTGSRLYTRYEGVRQARNDVIYTQDDDCLVTHIADFISAYDPELVVANCKAERRAFYESVSGGRIALIGYGAIFNKRLIDGIDSFRNWLRDDELFNREADRVFTFLNKVKLIETEFVDFPSWLTGMFTEEGHWEKLTRILGKLREYEAASLGDRI